MDVAEPSATPGAALGPAAAGDAGPEPLARWLIIHTNDLHTLALRAPLFQQMMQRTIAADLYARWLAALYYIYTELEYQVDRALQLSAPGDCHPVKLVDDTRLRRLPNIKQDLLFFYGPAWESQLPGPTLFTIRYVARISDIAHDRHRLLIHHWMRYGGGLAGGQFLRTVKSALGARRCQALQHRRCAWCELLRV